MHWALTDLEYRDNITEILQVERYSFFILKHLLTIIILFIRYHGSYSDLQVINLYSDLRLVNQIAVFSLLVT